VCACPSDPTTDAFVEALHHLQNPQLWLSDGLKAMSKALRSKSMSPLEAKKKALAIYKKTHARVFGETGRSSSRGSSSGGSGGGGGSINRDFATKWRRVVEAKFGADGSKVDKDSVSGLYPLIFNINVLGKKKYSPFFSI
jgi:hypothetical protein